MLARVELDVRLFFQVFFSFLKGSICVLIAIDLKRTINLNYICIGIFRNKKKYLEKQTCVDFNPGSHVALSQVPWILSFQSSNKLNYELRFSAELIHYRSTLTRFPGLKHRVVIRADQLWRP